MNLTREKLLEMVVDAYDACRSENMFCPWCSGVVSADEDRHDQFCLWPYVAAEWKAQGKKVDT